MPDNKIKELEQEVEKLKLRNKKVEAEKAWETSKERKICILILTYIIISFVMWILGFEKPLLNALIPSFGYLLSTVSIGFIKKIYINRYMKKGDQK